MYKPNWTEEFKRLNPDVREMNAKKERLAVDVMIDVKEPELRTSPKARQYEEDRKRDWNLYRKEKSQKDKLLTLKIDRAKAFAERFLAQRMKQKNARTK